MLLNMADTNSRDTLLVFDMADTKSGDPPHDPNVYIPIFIDLVHVVWRSHSLLLWLFTVVA